MSPENSVSNLHTIGKTWNERDMNQTLAALSLSFHGEVAVVFCLHHFFTQKSGRQKTMTAGDRFTRDEREQENEMWSDQTLDLPSLEVSVDHTFSCPMSRAAVKTCHNVCRPVFPVEFIVGEKPTARWSTTASLQPMINSPDRKVVSLDDTYDDRHLNTASVISRLSKEKARGLGHN